MALVPTRASFIACAAKHTLAKEDEDAESLLKGIIVHLFTPVGASLQYYANSQDWGEFSRKHGTLGVQSDDVDVSRETIVLALFELFHEFNSKMHRSLLSREYGARGLARTAFTPTMKKSTSTWQHGMFQTLLLDKLVWASLPRPVQDLRPLQEPYIEESDELEEKTEDVLNLYREWPDTLSKFVQSWATAENARSSAGEEEQACQDYSAVLSSLYRGSIQSFSSAHISKVEHNCCVAAVGLLGLMLVRYITLTVYFRVLIFNYTLSVQSIVGINLPAKNPLLPVQS